MSGLRLLRTSSACVGYDIKHKMRVCTRTRRLLYTHAQVDACTSTRMHTSTHAQVHAWTITLMHKYTHAHVHACTRLRMHTSTHDRLHACTDTPCTRTRMHKYTHAQIHACTSTRMKNYVHNVCISWMLCSNGYICVSANITKLYILYLLKISFGSLYNYRCSS